MSQTYIDLTYALDENVQIYPGDPAFSCCPIQTISKNGNNVHSISLGSHAGTHVDAPYHFVEDGARIDEVPISAFVGNAVVIDLTSKTSRELITWEDISPYTELIRRKTQLPDGVFVLLHTGWSRYWQSPTYLDHLFLTRDASQRLLGLGVKLLGVDTLSPDETHVDSSAHSDFGVHQAILGAGALIAENLTSLEAIRTGDWLVNLVPLKLKGCDGSPVRAFAWRVDSGNCNTESDTH
ncbi:putative cyclase [Trametes gibbosa]|nr:putative cyclase [Trametes gibbosa]